MTEEPFVPRTLHASMVQAGRAIGAVAKNLRNVESMYAARSIDDILDAVHGPLNEAGLVLTIETLQRETETRGRMNYVAYLVRFEFRGEDDKICATTLWGEGADVADKAGNKALSAALKMALIQTFTIPVNGDTADGDSGTPEGTADDPAPIVYASRLRTDQVVERLEAIFKRTGKRHYPKAWKAVPLPSLPALANRCFTTAEYAAAVDVLKETETMLDATSPETAPVDVCGSCGLTGGAHEPQCPEEPF